MPGICLSVHPQATSRKSGNMPRREIEFVPNACYHIYNRGCGHQPIFFEVDNYLFFLRELKRRCQAFHVGVLAWCLMPNHYHLLVSPRSEHFSEMMQSFSTCYTKAINARQQRTGTLFEGRFQAIAVETTEYVIHLSRYLHLNPVEARLVKKPEEYDYSSYRDYLGLRAGTLAQPARVLSEFAGAEQYRLFVESGIGKRDAIVNGMKLEEE
jgi:putative transposase